MSEPSQDLNEIEVLLASRHRLNEWLAKLQVAGSKVAPTVRQRVREDYEGRLAQVVDQLRSHNDVIAKTLGGLRENATHFKQFRAEEQDTLSEAQLRHVVGEYSDDEWQGVEKECSTKIAEYDEELRRLASEIARLDEVQTWISTAPPAPEVAPAALEVSVTEAEDLNPLDLPSQPPLALVKDEEPEPAPPVAIPEPVIERKPVVAEAAPEAPRFVPRNPPPKARESGRSPTPAPAPQPAPQSTPPKAATDELAFLKSVSLDPRAPAPAAASANTLVENRTERPAQQQAAKTLKCGECGALNRPTEWYCERCGAELAAV